MHHGEKLQTKASKNKTAKAQKAQPYDLQFHQIESDRRPLPFEFDKNSHHKKTQALSIVSVNRSTSSVVRHKRRID